MGDQAAASLKALIRRLEKTVGGEQTDERFGAPDRSAQYRACRWWARLVSRSLGTFSFSREQGPGDTLRAVLFSAPNRPSAPAPYVLQRSAPQNPKMHSAEPPWLAPTARSASPRSATPAVDRAS